MITDLAVLVKQEKVPVIRGKLGATQSISVWDVVVGDVVLLETGASVPADCLIIEASDLQVDTPEYTDKDGKPIRETSEINKNAEDPALIAGSIIRKGNCKAVVCVVGKNSTRGIVDKPLDTDKDTAVQRKLKNLGVRFSHFAILVCLIVLVLIAIMLAVKMGGDEPWYKVLF